MLTLAQFFPDELCADAQSSQGTANGPSLSLLHEVLKAFPSFGTGARGFATFAILHGGPKPRIALGEVDAHLVSSNEAMRIFLPEPHQPPFHFEVIILRDFPRTGGLVPDFAR